MRRDPSARAPRMLKRIDAVTGSEPRQFRPLQESVKVGNRMAEEQGSIRQWRRRNCFTGNPPSSCIIIVAIIVLCAP